jgi:hypothetical protein
MDDASLDVEPLDTALHGQIIPLMVTSLSRWITHTYSRHFWQNERNDPDF